MKDMVSFLRIRSILFLLLTCLIFDDQGSSGGGGSAGPSSIHSFYSELIFSSLQTQTSKKDSGLILWAVNMKEKEMECSVGRTSFKSSTTKESSSTSLLLHCFQVSFSFPLVSQLKRSMM